MSEPEPLAVEWQTYLQHRDELLAEHEGQFVLIHRDRVIETFHAREDALRHGYRQLGAVPFLVHRIMRMEQTSTFANDNLGL